MVWIPKFARDPQRSRAVGREAKEYAEKLKNIEKPFSIGV
jgi:hypothetical protein